jgi:hypothetical protein
MKTTNPKLNSMHSRLAAAGLMLVASIGVVQANTIVDRFNTTNEANAWTCTSIPWGITGTNEFSSNDAISSSTPGSIKFTVPFSAGGDNTNANVRFTTTAPPSTDLSAATNIEFDLMVDPASALDPNGNLAYFQVGINGAQTGSGFWWGPWGTGTITKGVWQHFKVSFPAGTIASSASQFFINPYNNNWSGNATVIFYMDNIVIDTPSYPEFDAFVFNDLSTGTNVGTNWYGHPVVGEWATNQSTLSGLPSSGSLHIIANLSANDNNVVCAIPFDITNYQGFSGPADTNIVLNCQNYDTCELDLLWDTNLSTVAISNFNSLGDVAGFPLGLLINSGGGGGGQVEAFGSSTTTIPDSASNGWVHLSFPINRVSAGIDQTIGLWLKKYSGNTNAAFTGTVAFYIDNVKFLGSTIPLVQAGPTVSISKPTYGLQLVSTATGGNVQYDRESLVTYAAAPYTFVNQASPVTYAFNIAYMPPSTGGGNYLALIMLVPSDSANSINGTDVEPDYVDPNILILSLQRNGNGIGTFVALGAKAGQPNGNGSLYDNTKNRSWNSPSDPKGQWTMTIANNTNITVTAPDGSSVTTNFPWGFNSSDVAANFDFGEGIYAYFGSSCNGSANEGQRIVLGSAGVTNGSSSVLWDHFATDTTLSIGTGQTWLRMSESSTRPAYACGLLPLTTQWMLDWTVPGSGNSVLTNATLSKNGWGSTGLQGLLDATHYHQDIDVTNLPPTADGFFRLSNP